MDQAQESPENIDSDNEVIDISDTDDVEEEFDNGISELDVNESAKFHNPPISLQVKIYSKV